MSDSFTWPFFSILFPFSGSSTKTTSPKEQQNSQFSKHGVYIREDDQDWGSAGIDSLEQETNQS